jgi:hypothetical protein
VRSLLRTSSFAEATEDKSVRADDKSSAPPTTTFTRFAEIRRLEDMMKSFHKNKPKGNHRVQ